MRRLILALAASLLLIGCATQKYTPTSQKKDSTYVSKQYLDQLISSAFRHDSVYVHDSVFVKEKGDTVTKYVEKVRYKYQIVHDTVHHTGTLHDTTFIEKRDTTTLIEKVEVEKPIRWYDKGFIWFGRVCCIAALFWILFLYLKRRV